MINLFIKLIIIINLETLAFSSVGWVCIWQVRLPITNYADD